MAEQKQSILIVDDDKDVRTSYAEKFRQSGFEVFEAQDGLEALEVLSEHVPDVVFTGIIMPRFSGFDLIEAMRKNVKTARLPVVISSHLGRKEDLDKAHELGVLDFIVRGEISFEEAVERVHRVLGKRYIYQVVVGKDRFDARAFAEMLGVESTYTCSSCDGELVVAIEYFPKERMFKVDAVCTQCGKVNSRV